MKSIIVDKVSFEDSIDKFEKTVNEINDILDKMKKSMTEINGNNDTWKSKVGVAVHERYSESEKKFENINSELNKYTVFLKQTLNSYKEAEEIQEKSIEEQQKNLDVNE